MYQVLSKAKLSALVLSLLLVSCAPPQGNVQEGDEATCAHRLADGGCNDLDFFVGKDNQITAERPSHDDFGGSENVENDTDEGKSEGDVNGWDGSGDLSKQLGQPEDATPGPIPTFENDDSPNGNDDHGSDGTSDDGDEDGEDSAGGHAPGSVSSGSSGGHSGSGLKKVMADALKGFGDALGINKKKKKQKEREIRAKVEEALDLKKKIDELTTSAKDNYAEDTKALDALSSGAYQGSNDVKREITKQGRGHNNGLTPIPTKLPEIKNQVPKDVPSDPVTDKPCYQSKDCNYDSIEQKKVRDAHDYVSGARDIVKSTYNGQDLQTRERMLDTADSTVDAANTFYDQGETVLGDASVELALKTADFAVGMIPIVGDIVDIASAVAGENLITGEPISDGEAYAQAAVAITSLATGGAFGAINDIRKGTKVLKQAIKEEVKREAKKEAKNLASKEIKEQIKKEQNRRQRDVQDGVDDRQARMDGEKTKGFGTPEGPKVEEGKQGKHIPGHNNFDERKSVLTADAGELAKQAGKGQQVGNLPVGVPGSKERVTYDKIIGVQVDKDTGVRTPTNTAIIHYSKEGIHMVPVRPQP